MKRLCDNTIDIVWQKLTVSYGRRFVALWDGMPIEPIKDAWAQELGEFEDAAVMAALDRIPGDPLKFSLPALKALCRAEREASTPAAFLPAPAEKPSPMGLRRLAAVMDRLRSAAVRPADVRAQTLSKLEAVVAEGGRLSSQQRAHLEVLRRELPRGEADERGDDGKPLLTGREIPLPRRAVGEPDPPESTVGQLHEPLADRARKAA